MVQAAVRAPIPTWAIQPLITQKRRFSSTSSSFPDDVIRIFTQIACIQTYWCTLNVFSEFQAVQDLAQEKQPFSYLSFHTYGEYWLEPYGDGTPVDNVSGAL